LEFWDEDDWLIDTGLVPLQLTDLVVPGEHSKDIRDIDTSYDLDTLLGMLGGKLEKIE
jgi:hypothetical protein